MKPRVTPHVFARVSSGPFEVAPMLRQEVHPEGLDSARVRALESASLALAAPGGQIVSMVRGRGRFDVGGERLAMSAGVHVFVPPSLPASLELEAGSEVVMVSAPDARRTRGRRLLVRDEEFLAASAVGAQALRWILTPQYLSRRIFLHHDEALLSASGHPVSWFRTTMFDVEGLPPNQDGEPVFKMAYNSRTEWNGMYEVVGQARARFARHPYASAAWSPWAPLTSESSYHLFETAGGPDEEVESDPETGKRRTLRNKHEVHVARGGHASLFCLFDPAPTGVERHRPGEYSDYEPLADVMASEEYAVSRREIARFDAMVDRLSLAKAKGALGALEGSADWALFREGQAAQRAIEERLYETLAREGRGRERVIAPWMDRREPGA